MEELPHHGLKIRHPGAVSYFLATHTYVPTPNPILSPLQEPIFIILDKLSQSAVSYFQLPAKTSSEIGNQIEI